MTPILILHVSPSGVECLISRVMNGWHLNLLTISAGLILVIMKNARKHRMHLNHSLISFTGDV